MYLIICLIYTKSFTINTPKLPHQDLNNVAGFLENLTLKSIEQQKYIMYLYCTYILDGNTNM